ncbi:MAG: glycosyltransferase family A protein, partial [Gammaproteobacteria bacterium]
MALLRLPVVSNRCPLGFALLSPTYGAQVNLRVPWICLDDCGHGRAVVLFDSVVLDTSMNAQSAQRNDLISVIMPCFNAQRFVGEAVDSVFSQTDVTVELIVVDDGSTDGSRDVLASLAQRHADRMTVLHQQNRGPYPARNLALEHSKGDLVAFLDADDYWDPTCLA